MRQILVSYVQQSHIPRPGTKIKTYYCSISVFFEQTKIPEKGEKGEEKEEEGKEEEEEETTIIARMDRMNLGGDGGRD